MLIFRTRVAFASLGLAQVIGCSSAPPEDAAAVSHAQTVAHHHATNDDAGSAREDASGTKDSGANDAGSKGNDASACTVYNDCQGNPECIDCLESGECAEGPDPIWYNGNCRCWDPKACEVTLCCYPGDHWDQNQCDCVPN